MSLPSSTRIGRYDNPYRVAVWHRDPPPDTTCTPLLLDTQDRALARGWLYARGGESTVAILMHPRADFSQHYATPGLLDAGIAVLTVNSRWLNNDATLIHEQVLLDVAAAVAAARARYDRVVLVGNSGGASLFTFYVHEVHAPAGARLSETAAGDRFDLNDFDLPGADAMVYLAGHAGEGHYLLHAIDPSVTDEDDPVSRAPALDLYDPDNGFVEPPAEPRYEPEFLARYRGAQRARVERIDARARELVAAKHAARRCLGGWFRDDERSSPGDRDALPARVPHRRRPAGSTSPSSPPTATTARSGGAGRTGSTTAPSASGGSSPPRRGSRRGRGCPRRPRSRAPAPG